MIQALLPCRLFPEEWCRGTVAVGLKTDCVVGTYSEAVETTHTTRIVDVTPRYLNTIRFAYFFTLHTVDAAVRVDLDMIEREVVEAAQGCPYGADSGAETASRKYGTYDYEHKREYAGGDPGAHTDSERSPGGLERRRIGYRADVAHHVPGFYPIVYRCDSQEH